MRAVERMFFGVVCATIAFALAGVAEIILTNTSVQTIALQIPQYLFISAAEVLIAVQGLDFAYTQSPECTKSIVTAIWFLTMVL